MRKKWEMPLWDTKSICFLWIWMVSLTAFYMLVCIQFSSFLESSLLKNQDAIDWIHRILAKDAIFDIIPGGIIIQRPKLRFFFLILSKRLYLLQLSVQHTNIVWLFSLYYSPCREMNASGEVTTFSFYHQLKELYFPYVH